MGTERRDDHDDGSGESEKQRVDRELIELLNELRVALPGVQVLFAFMLVVPFNQRFVDLSTVERWVYYAALLSAALATVLLIAPSSYHRLRFRQGDKEQMLFTSNRLLVSGLVCVAVSMTLALGLISEFVFGTWLAAVAGIGIGAALAWFWYGLPLSRRMQE
jgi:type IV secretory pathway TrbD component